MNIRIGELYNTLYSHYGNTGWWPAGSADEIIIGTILTQNTAWKNVEMSLEKLRSDGLMDLGKLAKADPQHLGAMIRSSGFYNQKSGRLIDRSRSILTAFGNIEEMKLVPLEELQRFLAAISGVGQETMDSILLYALEKPVFVVDKYTLRILSRIGLSGSETIEKVKELVYSDLGKNVESMKNLHGMIVFLAKDFCKTRPKCENCPILAKCDHGRAQS